MFRCILRRGPTQCNRRNQPNAAAHAAKTKQHRTLHAYVRKEFTKVGRTDKEAYYSLCSTCRLLLAEAVRVRFCISTATLCTYGWANSQRLLGRKSRPCLTFFFLRFVYLNSKRVPEFQNSPGNFPAIFRRKVSPPRKLHTRLDLLVRELY